MSSGWPLRNQFGSSDSVPSLHVWTATMLAQFDPEKPVMQVHVYAFESSVHIPPFWHGPDAHSFISMAQPPPANPGGHA